MSTDRIIIHNSLAGAFIPRYVERVKALPAGDPADEPMAPFGGVKNSGCGRFGGTAGIESFTERRWVTIQHNGRTAYPF